LEATEVITVQIPGGTAEMRSETSELSPRRKRPLEILGSRIGKSIEAVSTATRLYCDGELMEDKSETFNEDGSLTFAGGDVHVTEKQLGLIGRFGDALVWALLKSWTLDIPLPEDPDELLDIPGDVFDALSKEAAKINADIAAEREGFTVDGGMDDDAAPTGPSAE
jgi:hypothetical protein